MDEDKTYIVTFGFGQVHENKYHELQANSYEEAREDVIRTFGMNWSMLYSPPNASEQAGVINFNLTELK